MANIHYSTANKLATFATNLTMNKVFNAHLTANKLKPN